MTNLVAFNQALADETRWRIIQLLLEEALCVCELADILGMPQSSVSSHVQVIRQAGMLESEKCGKWIYSRVEPRHRQMVLALGKFFAVSAETDATLRKDARNAVKRLSLREESCCPLPQKLVRRRTGGTPSKERTRILSPISLA